MSEILVITCPSGKQCTHLISHIYGKGHFKLRLAAHSDSSAKKLQDLYPDAEVAQVDLSVLADCIRLLHGATSVYHVGPSFHSREKEMGLNMVDAAVIESQRSGNVFKHFVYSSVLDTQLRQLMQHTLKSFVEERLMISPLNWTIVKPTNFMDTYPVQFLAKSDSPSFQKLWSPDIPNSVIALRDLAEASVRVLVEREKHYFAEYPLCSTMPVSDKAIIQAIGKAIGKDIQLSTPSFEQAVSNAMNYLFGGKSSDVYSSEKTEAFKLAAEGDVRGDICRDEAERLIVFYSRRGLVGNPNVLRWLLGREPTTVDEWIQLQLKGDDPIL